ncbi:MAG TPA: NAD-dependent succinate-semialdehyde dehydrogenase [Longimicrobiales bacterium]|nr:NAD-dependent succinate-semialdehyde dehydrogenase [Longimicrobiales bacterium]
MESRNPATGELIERYEPHDEAEVEARIARAFEVWRSYRRTSHQERSAWLARAAEILDGEKAELGRLMTLEMGKPIRAAVAEAEKCAWACRFYAEEGAGFLADEPAETDAARSHVRYEPLGPVLAIMPWNFPFWQVFRFAAPALMAGNVGLLKHASNVPGCALAIEDILKRAGFPEGAFQTLLVGAEAVAGILEDARVRAVTLTGSEAAGRAVGAAAGGAIKKSVLELGGSDAFVVLPSADLQAALDTAVKARIVNNGQSCIAAKRFIVHEAIADTFLTGFVERMEALTVGDPLDPAIDIGPLATEQIRSGLEEQVRATVEAGARVLTGGERVAGAGWFYPPTVLVDAPAGSPARVDELFGPVATVLVARDLDHAIELANETGFGLGAAGWTQDAAERTRLVEELEAGMVFINAMVASDPRLPFGGVKRSGYGRELGRHGIREFTNAKSVSIQPGGLASLEETE